MAKYIIVDGRDHEEWTIEFDNREEAIKELMSEWECLSKYDKENVKYMYVLESVNQDEEAPDHFEGEYVAELVEVEGFSKSEREIIDFTKIEKWTDETGEVYEETYKNEDEVRFAYIDGIASWVRIGSEE